jgi:protein phosphatase
VAELRWGAATHAGLVRDANEDAFVAEPLVFGVADGMGGHRAGEVASALASTTLRDRLSSGAPNIDVVVAAVLEANASIFDAAHLNAAQQGMGTTVTALAVIAATADEPEQLALVNVGDSRTYLHRNGELTRATVDHSYVQELVATGHITETEARTHPRRNIVTRALGIEPTVRVDAWMLPIVRGDRFILCSDGLVDEVPDHEIADIAGGIEDPQRAADELVAMANRHGGRDNVTVVVVDVLDGVDPARDGTGDDTPATRDEAGDAPVLAADDWTRDATTVLPTAAGADVTQVLPTAPSGDARTADGGVAGAVPAEDDTAEMDASLVEGATATASGTRRRRISRRRILVVLLAVAALLSVGISLIVLALGDDDPAPSPSTTTPTAETSPDSAETVPDTEPDTTDSPSTEAAVDPTVTSDVPTTRRPPTTTRATTPATTPTTVRAPVTPTP